MFIERNLEFATRQGLIAMITMQSWMFLSRYQQLREKLVSDNPICSMAHLGTGAFDSIGGEVVSTTAFVLVKHGDRKLRGEFLDLRSGRSEAEKSSELFRIAKGDSRPRTVSSETFQVVEGTPIAHWISDNFRSCFSKFAAIKDVFKPAVGLNTGDNDRFLRQWHEISHTSICFSATSIEDAASRSQKWFPYNKGGGHRKWYGNQNFVLNWFNDGRELKEFATQRNSGKHWSRYIQNLDKMFLECVTWSDISTSSFAARYSPPGFLFDVKGSSGVPHDNSNLVPVLSLLCSNLMPEFMKCVNPTSTFQVGDLARVPYSKPGSSYELNEEPTQVISIAKSDWDNYETSWDFTNLPLLSPDYRHLNVKATYRKLRDHWCEMTLKMKKLEEENNRIFIDAYGLQEELKPEVQLNEITLTCNPHYRYGGDKSEDELEALMLADTMRELVSYAVGCMFGRYSLDKPGLILANQGETLSDYLRQVPEPSFPADDDNVIPMLDGDWFTDDMAQRFRQFLRVAFGEAHYEENLLFVEKALGKKGKPQPIRDYFLKEFYSDHVKRYKKRPIYWLFSSPKGTFNALIYLHRYRPDTVSVVLNGYLRDFRNKLAAHLSYLQQVGVSATASQVEKTRANKEIDTIKKQLQELDDYERDVLYPLATKQEPLNLDDGVKVNYLKLGPALKKIVGLDAKEED